MNKVGETHQESFGKKVSVIKKRNEIWELNSGLKSKICNIGSHSCGDGSRCNSVWPL